MAPYPVSAAFCPPKPGCRSLLRALLEFLLKFPPGGFRLRCFFVKAAAASADVTVKRCRFGRVNQWMGRMGARYSKIRNSAGMWLAAISGLMCVLYSRADEAYLPLVGPAPLRFEQARTYRPPAPAASEPIAVSTLQSPEIPDIVPSVLSTNAPAVSTPEMVSTNDTMAEPITASRDQTTLVPTAPLPAAPGDVGYVTPQMLTEYFRPAPGRTNQLRAAVFVPVEIEFRPPSPGPQASSQAVYKSP